jgi:hypothetical protein
MGSIQGDIDSIRCVAVMSRDKKGKRGWKALKLL